MAYFLPGEEGAFFLEELDDGLVGPEDELAGELGDLGGEPAGLVHRGVDIEAVLQAQLVVVLAVARGRMHAARARLEGYVPSGQQGRVPLDEGVAGP